MNTFCFESKATNVSLSTHQVIQKNQDYVHKDLFITINPVLEICDTK